jgi:hypothetical protein
MTKVCLIIHSECIPNTLMTSFSVWDIMKLFKLPFHNYANDEKSQKLHND